MTEETNEEYNTLESLYDISTTPMEPELQPYVWAKSHKTACQSFYDAKNFKEQDPHKNTPPPCYIHPKYIERKVPTNVETIFESYKKQPDGSLLMVDEDVRKAQAGIIYEVLKKAGLSILEGKGVVGLSQPVRIFESRSSIERVTDVFSFAPYYLNQCANSDPVEKIRCTLAMIVASQPFTVQPLKPFNPILGETYSCTFEDGTSVDLEHTSHHPPISNYYIVGKKFKIHGSIGYNVEVKSNKMNAFNEGWGVVEWEDGSTVKICFPMMQFGGTIMGSRDVKFIATTTVVDELMSMKAVLKMGADAKGGQSSWVFTQKQDTFKGNLYMYDKKIHQEICKQKWPQMIRQFADMKDKLQNIEELSGSWQEGLKCGKKEYWNIKTDLANCQEKYMTTSPLPSDCRYREDQIWLAIGNLDYAQNWKVKLEEQQRHDRATRNKFVKPDPEVIANQLHFEEITGNMEVPEDAVENKKK